MEEIKLGEYVRTKNGVIFKITGGNVDNYDIGISYYELGYFEDCYYSDLDMFNYNDNGNLIREITKKHSFNIIDLIEEGDYVNGKQIIKILNIKVHDAETKLLIYDDKLLGKGLYRGAFKENEIKSIVSHEMFEGIKYEVN